MRSIREQKKSSILAMVTISGEVVFEVIIPILMANLIDYGIDAGNMPYVAKMGLILLLSAAGQLSVRRDLRQICRRGLERLRAEPAPRHVLQGADLLVLEH